MTATQDADDEERIDWSNYVTGFAGDQSAYRSELAAALLVCSLLVWQFSLSIFHIISNSTITIALDGKSALDEASGDWPLQIDQPCFDYSR